MIFSQDNYLVRFYIRKINDNTITRDQVPALFNLREVVYRILDSE